MKFEEKLIQLRKARGLVFASSLHQFRHLLFRRISKQTLT